MIIKYSGPFTALISSSPFPSRFLTTAEALAITAAEQTTKEREVNNDFLLCKLIRNPRGNFYSHSMEQNLVTIGQNVREAAWLRVNFYRQPTKLTNDYTDLLCPY